MTGSMMVLTYLATCLAATADAAVDERALAFGLAGVAGMLGIWGGGLATDSWGAGRTLAIGVGTFVVTMIALWALWFTRPSPIGPVLRWRRSGEAWPSGTRPRSRPACTLSRERSRPRHSL